MPRSPATDPCGRFDRPCLQHSHEQPVGRCEWHPSGCASMSPRLEDRGFTEVSKLRHCPDEAPSLLARGPVSLQSARFRPGPQRRNALGNAALAFDRGRASPPCRDRNSRLFFRTRRGLFPETHGCGSGCSSRSVRRGRACDTWLTYPASLDLHSMNATAENAEDRACAVRPRASADRARIGAT